MKLELDLTPEQYQQLLECVHSIRFRNKTAPRWCAINAVYRVPLQLQKSINSLIKSYS